MWLRGCLPPTKIPRFFPFVYILYMMILTIFLLLFDISFLIFLSGFLLPPPDYFWDVSDCTENVRKSMSSSLAYAYGNNSIANNRHIPGTAIMQTRPHPLEQHICSPRQSVSSEQDSTHDPTWSSGTAGHMTEINRKGHTFVQISR